MRTDSGVRYFAAVLSAAAGALYLLIAAGVLTVVSTAPKAGDAVIPAIAGAAFVLLALGLALSTRRALEIVGMGMALLAIAGYFVVAPNRTPSFEAWGIVIKFIQGALVLALGYLLVRLPAGSRRARGVT